MSMDEQGRRDVIRRLGAQFLECPVCNRAFNALHLPRHWINVMIDGEIIDPGPKSDDLMCSEECGVQHAADKNAKNRRWPRIKYVYIPEEQR